MDQFEFAAIVSSPDNTIRYLRENNLLESHKLCEQCQVYMVQIRKNSLSDTYIWQCPNRQCRNRASIRQNSFFTFSKLRLAIIVSAIYYFCASCSIKQTLQFFNGHISKRALIDYFNYFREGCSEVLLRRRNFKLGGVGDIVEIDESFIGRKRKYNRGAHDYNNKTIVLGFYERRREKALLFIIPDQTRASIYPLILRYVAPGTIIYTDEAPVYKQLDRSI